MKCNLKMNKLLTAGFITHSAKLRRGCWKSQAIGGDLLGQKQW